MTLCEYLNTYFPNGVDGIFNELPVNLFIHFTEKFGVDVKNEGNLYQFKYNMITAKWSFPITHECRGIILRHNEEWKIVARPFYKFWNSHESYCIVNDSNFQNNFQIVEKSDGTLVIMSFDEELNKWRFSTQGCITTQNYDDSNDTFENLFLKTIKNINYDRFDKENTYLFELCTYSNRIVTKYPEDIVYLLAIRNNKYGNYITDQVVDSFSEDMFLKDNSNVKRPEMKFLYELNINNFTEIKDYVEKESLNPKYGEFPEGFVIYRGGIPVAKIKNSRYLQAHAVGGGNKAHAKNVIIESIFNGTLDDVYDTLIPELMDFAEKIKENVREKTAHLILLSNNTKNNEFPTQKDYALFVQKNVQPIYHSFFFQYKKDIMNGNINNSINKWMKDSYSKFVDEWKGRNE